MARVKFVADCPFAPPVSSIPSSPPDASSDSSSDTVELPPPLPLPLPLPPPPPPRPRPRPRPPPEPVLRRSIRNVEKMSADEYRARWDDWVPQDRLRKLTEDNRELAASLRRDAMQVESRQRNPKAGTTSKKGRTQGSEIGSGRGSEERNSSVPAGGRGSKRGKDNELEKVATPEFSTPRRSSRLQSTGFPSNTLPNFPHPTPSGSGQDNHDELDEYETDSGDTDQVINGYVAKSAEVLAGVASGSINSSKLNDGKGRVYNLQDRPAPRSSGQTSSRRLGTGQNSSHHPYSSSQNSSGQGSSGQSTSVQDLSRDTSDQDSSGRIVQGQNLRVQVDLGGRATLPDRGVKTMASRRIHGWYDEDEVFIPNKTKYTPRTDLFKPEVISRRGYFKDGNYYAPELDAASDGKSPVEPRLSRRSARSTCASNPPPTPNAEAVDGEMTFEAVMETLNKPPPPDEPEHVSIQSLNTGHRWAPLIGGTTQSEKALIEEEAQELDLWTPKRPQVHPEYARTRIEDPLNAAKLLFYEDQDPDRVMMIAGVPKDPFYVELPGSGGRLDALNFPDRLLKFPTTVLGNLTPANLQQLDRATILRFPHAALRMLPPKFLAKLKIAVPCILAPPPHNNNNDDDDDDDDKNDNNPLFSSLSHPQEENFFSRPSVHIPVPDLIKGYLVDDWENTTKNLELVALPSRAPVNWVLDSYFHEEKGKRRLGSPEAQQLVEIVEGMKMYFVRMLGKALLYKFERVQYSEVCVFFLCVCATWGGGDERCGSGCWREGITDAGVFDADV
jgi:MRG